MQESQRPRGSSHVEQERRLRVGFCAACFSLAQPRRLDRADVATRRRRERRRWCCGHKGSWANGKSDQQQPRLHKKQPDSEEEVARAGETGWAGLAPQGGARGRRRGQQPRRPDLGALDAFPERRSRRHERVKIGSTGARAAAQNSKVATRARKKEPRLATSRATDARHRALSCAAVWLRRSSLDTETALNDVAVVLYGFSFVQAVCRAVGHRRCVDRLAATGSQALPLKLEATAKMPS